ncbi:MAG: hypothetical protein A2V81_03640 [Candidatus Abawacabacteria bacterium RBG_16_42_10]|uniref:Uncharacterized protein n=1 Tax=Candidatus Abawacabacteria bacterium RBG_16_42_10 TaxID=1817814 RepID=A0A1F4XK04_9BACT|nr:MAG: hypothetical protein A2V81_03640 [Candidatus Abawacabacteria bacterium RBG_16_42_10]
MVVKSLYFLFGRVLLIAISLLCSLQIVFAGTEVTMPPPPEGSEPGSAGIGTGVPAAPTGSEPGSADIGTGVPAPTAGSAPGSAELGSPTSGGAGSSGSPLQIVAPPAHGLPGSGGVEALITTVVNNVLNFVAIIAIVAIVFSAIQFLLAQGRADAIGKAKKNLFNVVLGFAILMLAWSFVYIILQFLGFGR